METYSFSELYFASTERSLVSGMPGLGIRTCTKGLNSETVLSLANSCVMGYPVYGERILDRQQIIQNPRIVYDYAPMFSFMVVELKNGEKKYVFSRTVYIGMDYGFFQESGRDDRDGTNYFAHLIIFNEAPSISFFSRLNTESLFVPRDYTCIPNNPELLNLLTGNPTTLEPRVLTFNDTIECLTENLPYAGEVICGLLQMIKNKRAENNLELPVKAIVKCKASITQRYLMLFSLFPQDTLNDIRFLTNYMRGYEVPSEYDIVFVNEFNSIELYENNYITIDLLSEPKMNYKSNFFLDKINSIIKQGDSKILTELIRFYLGLEERGDEEYEFYYNVFLGAFSDWDIKLSDISEATINKLKDLRLDHAQGAAFWGKVNKALNEGLKATQGRDFLLAVEKIKLFNAYCPGKVHILDDCINYVTIILFSGRGNFGKIANEDNISTLLKLVDKSQIPSENLFLSSLGESSKVKVWEESLEFYYNGQYDGNESILETIFNSNLAEASICVLITRVFPLSRYADILFDYFKNHTADTVKANSIVSSLVNYYGEKRFSDFVWLGQIEPGILNVASPIISSYYQEKVSSNVKYGVSSLFDFLEKVGCDQISTLNLWSVVKIVTQHYLGESINDIKGFLSKVEEIGIPYQGHIDDEIELLKCLADHEIPSRVSSSYLSAAIRLYPGDANYIESLFSNWLETGVRKDEIKSFIVANKNELSDSSISNIIKTIWGCTAIHNNSEKESMVLALIDNCGWDRKKVEEFSLQCGSKDLEKFLLKSNGFFDKLVRKIFK